MAGSSVTTLPTNGRDWMFRRFETLERVVAQLGPSVAKSVSGIVSGLQAAVADLATQQATLTTQQGTLNTAVGNIATQQATLNTQQATLASQQGTLNTQQATLASQVALLTAVADVKYAESTTGITGFTGFYTGTLPEVTLTSPSGRIEVACGGTLNGGDGYFCFSVTGAVSGALVTAASVQANPARRVAVTGGASFAPSGHRSMVLTVPPNEALTVRLAYYAGTSFVYFFGGSILARVTP